MGKPVFIEKPNFSVKRAALQKRPNSAYNRMLTTFSFRIFEQIITRCSPQHQCALGCGELMRLPNMIRFIGAVVHLEHEMAEMFRLRSVYKRQAKRED